MPSRSPFTHVIGPYLDEAAWDTFNDMYLSYDFYLNPETPVHKGLTYRLRISRSGVQVHPSPSLINPIVSRFVTGTLLDMPNLAVVQAKLGSKVFVDILR